MTGKISHAMRYCVRSIRVDSFAAVFRNPISSIYFTRVWHRLQIREGSGCDESIRARSDDLPPMSLHGFEEVRRGEGKRRPQEVSNDGGRYGSYEEGELVKTL